MSAQSDKSRTAKVVNMVRLLDIPSRKRTDIPVEHRQSATLLSIRQNLIYQACIGVDDIDQLKLQCSKKLAAAVMRQVRGFLDAEFGQLRVHQYRQVFTVGHHRLEDLASGLLRVQMHARQVELPVLDNQCKPRLLSVNWGVGKSALEAEHERQRQQKLNN